MISIVKKRLEDIVKNVGSFASEKRVAQALLEGRSVRVKTSEVEFDVKPIISSKDIGVSPPGLSLWSITIEASHNSLWLKSCIPLSPLEELALCFRTRFYDSEDNESAR